MYDICQNITLKVAYNMQLLICGITDGFFMDDDELLHNARHHLG